MGESRTVMHSHTTAFFTEKSSMNLYICVFGFITLLFELRESTPFYLEVVVCADNYKFFNLAVSLWVCDSGNRRKG